MLEEQKEKPKANFYRWLVGKEDQAGNPKAEAKESTPEMAERLIALRAQIKDLEALHKALQVKLLSEVDWKKGGREVNTVHVGSYTLRRTKLYNLKMPEGFDQGAFAKAHPEFMKTSVHNQKLAKHIAKTGETFGLDKLGMEFGEGYSLQVAIQG